MFEVILFFAWTLFVLVLTIGLYTFLCEKYPNWCVTVPYLDEVAFKIVVSYIVLVFVGDYIKFISVVFIVVPFFALVWSSKEGFTQRKKLVVPLLINLIYLAVSYVALLMSLSMY